MNFFLTRKNRIY